jgi:hypothetical protein
MRDMPAYATQQAVYGTAFLNSILAAFKTVATAALVATAKVRLNINPAFNPGPGDTIAENAANEANFTGYTAGGAAVMLGSPVNLSPTCQGAIATANFAATSSGTFVSNVIHGYWIDDGTNVIFAEAFPAGVSFTFGVPGDFLELILQFPQQSNQPAV